MSDLVGTQIVGFLTHRLISKYIGNYGCFVSLLRYHRFEYMRWMLLADMLTFYFIFFSQRPDSFPLMSAVNDVKRNTDGALTFDGSLTTSIGIPFRFVYTMIGEHSKYSNAPKGFTVRIYTCRFDEYLHVVRHLFNAAKLIFYT